MKNTLVIVTFDENETYTIQNRVLAILLGDAVPAELVGTTDSNFYDHYSEIATVVSFFDPLFQTALISPLGGELGSRHSWSF